MDADAPQDIICIVIMKNNYVKKRVMFLFHAGNKFHDDSTCDLGSPRHVTICCCDSHNKFTDALLIRADE